MYHIGMRASPLPIRLISQFIDVLFNSNIMWVPGSTNKRLRGSLYDTANIVTASRDINSG